jgi:hypothetical protein
MSSKSIDGAMHKSYANTTFPLGMRDIVAARAQLLRTSTIVATAQALLLVNSFQECLELVTKYYGESLDELSKIHLSKIKSLAWKGRDSEITYLQKQLNSSMEIRDQIREGTIRERPYPWLRASQRYRSKSTIDSLREKLLEHSAARCTIKRWKTVDGLYGPPDCYGVYAKRKIFRGCEFLVEMTLLSAMDNPQRRCSSCCGPVHEHLNTITTRCCRLNFCRWYCLAEAQFTFQHGSKISCAGDLDTDANLKQLVSALVKEKVAGHRLRYRVLQYTIVELKDGTASHPLFSELVGGLAPRFSGSNHFSRHPDILLPQEMLKNLGVDIFKDHELDTWVLQMLFSKLKANSWGGPTEDGTVVAGVSQLYSFLNHSCRPNVALTQKGSQLTMKATRDIQPGEELCVSYLDWRSLKLPVNKREEKLVDWFPRCLCARCGEEREFGLGTMDWTSSDSDSEESVVPDVEIYGQDNDDSGNFDE